ncbi:MAG: DUF3455 domain-containing protein [Pyrinomonadaceae bacterium]
MQIINIKKIMCVAVLLVAGLVSTAAAQALTENPGPDLPSPLCDRVQVPAGNRLVTRAYAIGSQLYRWNGASWTFVEPVATLFPNADYRGEVAVHYAGPTWESNSGGKVAAARVDGCSVDPTAIDWLLLQAVSNEGQGPFRRVNYIQRVNTVGGRAPIAPGSAIGTVVQIPYTAEYCFYRAEN